MKPQKKYINVKTIAVIALGILLFGFVQGCKKFIDIPPPITELVNTSVFNNNSSATAALVNMYNTMFSSSESYIMAQNMGIYADELTSYDNQEALQIGLYTNALQATQSPGPWISQYGNYAYDYIYQANGVISNLQTISGCSPAVKQQLTGEAYFIRAFWHFYLTNIYGDVPLVLTQNFQTNTTIARSPRIMVLQQVVADLKTAKNLLNSNYVDGSDTATTTERVRPNKAAALALLARTYLYLGDYSKNPAYYIEADSAATAVISNSAYSLASLNGVFLANSTEAIWQIQTPQPPPIADTQDGPGFILLAAPSASVDNGTTISPQLMSAFESNDQRQTAWIGSYTDTAVTPHLTYYFPYKYKQRTYQGLEYTMVLRLGEQYLIRAEAEAEEGNKTANAVADLNAIRSRAGLPGYAGAQDKASLLTAIQHERQVELFTEWGARWFDLCRAVANPNETVNANSVMGPGSLPWQNVCHDKGGTWSSNSLLFPVPQQDLLRDPNLTQNPGY